MFYLYDNFNVLLHSLLNSSDGRVNEISTDCRRDVAQCHEGLSFPILSVLAKSLMELSTAPGLDNLKRLTTDLKKNLTRPTAIFPFYPGKKLKTKQSI